MEAVKYSQGMTNVWSDGDKITIENNTGIRHIKQNVEQIFGMGEWEKIRSVAYLEKDYAYDNQTSRKGYECISGYIPQRVIDDLAIGDELPEDVKKENALDALKDV